MTAGGTNKPAKPDSEERSCATSCCGNNAAKVNGSQNVTPEVTPKPLYKGDLVKPVPGKNPASRSGFLCSFLVDARGGAMTGHRHWGMRLVIPPGAVTQPTRVNCRYQPLQSLKFPPPFMEREALASRIIEISPAEQTFRSPVLLEIPHFASNAGAERETVTLRSNDGETWSLHVCDTVDDGEIYQDVVSSVTVDDSNLERIYDALEVKRGRVVRVLTSKFPKYFAIITRIRQEEKRLGPEGGKVCLAQDTRCRATFPKNAVYKKIKVGLQVQTMPHELVQAAFGRSVDVSAMVAIEPRKRKFHQPIFVSIPIPCPATSTTNIRLMCSVTSSLDPATWEDKTDTTELKVNKDVVHFSTKVSALFWILVIHDNQRDCSSALTLASRLYEESRLVPYFARISVFYREKFPKAWVNTLRIYCMTDDKAEKVVQSLQGFRPLIVSRDIEITDGSQIAVKIGGNILQLTEDPFTRELLPVSTIRHSFIRESFAFTAFQENALTLVVQAKDSSKPLEGSLTFYRKLNNISKTQNLLISHLNISSTGESGEEIKEDVMFHKHDETEFRVPDGPVEARKTDSVQNRPLPKLVESQYEEVKRKSSYPDEDLYEKIEVKCENGRTTLSKATSKIVEKSLTDGNEKTIKDVESPKKDEAAKKTEHESEKCTKLEKSNKKGERKDEEKVDLTESSNEKIKSDDQTNVEATGKKTDNKADENFEQVDNPTLPDYENKTSAKEKSRKKEEIKQKNKTLESPKSCKENELKSGDKKTISKSTSSLNKLKNAKIFQKKNKNKMKFKKGELDEMRRNFAHAQGVKTVEPRVEPNIPCTTQRKSYMLTDAPTTDKPVQAQQVPVNQYENREEVVEEICFEQKVPELTKETTNEQQQPVMTYEKSISTEESLAENLSSQIIEDVKEAVVDIDPTVNRTEVYKLEEVEMEPDLDKKADNTEEETPVHNYVEATDDDQSNNKDEHISTSPTDDTDYTIIPITIETNNTSTGREGGVDDTFKNDETSINRDNVEDKVDANIESCDMDCRTIPIEIEEVACMNNQEQVDNSVEELEKVADESIDEPSNTDGILKKEDDIIGFDVKPEPKVQDSPAVETVVAKNGQPKDSEVEKKKEKKKSFIKEWQQDLKEFFGGKKKKKSKLENDKETAVSKGPLKNDDEPKKSEIKQDTIKREGKKKHEKAIEANESTLAMDEEKDNKKVESETSNEPNVSQEAVQDDTKDVDCKSEEMILNNQNKENIPEPRERKKSKTNRRKTNSGSLEENVKITEIVKTSIETVESKDLGSNSDPVEVVSQTTQVVEEVKVKRRKNKKKNKDKEELDDAKERSGLAAGGKPKVVVPAPRGIPRPKPISRITETNSNRNSLISNDSFTDEELVVEAQFKGRAHSIEDSEEFQRAVDSFDEIFRSESGADVVGAIDDLASLPPPPTTAARRSAKKAKRTETKELTGMGGGVVNGRLTETLVGSVTVVQDFSCEDPDQMPNDFPIVDSVPLDAESVKNVDGASRQRKGSSRFMRRQNSSRSNRSSVGSQEEHQQQQQDSCGGEDGSDGQDVNSQHQRETVTMASLKRPESLESQSSERTSPDLTTRLLETNDQMQRLDQTFRDLCEEAESTSEVVTTTTTYKTSAVEVGMSSEGSDGSNTVQRTTTERGHSLTRTQVRVTEDPLDQMIEAMIQPSNNTQE